jgi:hypothetical protein
MSKQKEDNSNQNKSLELKRRIIKIWKLRTMRKKIIRYIKDRIIF